MEPFEIRPGAGAGNVALGFSTGRVRGLLGAPKEIDGDEWIYDDLGIAVTFENDKAVSIDAYGSITVDGKAIPDHGRTEIADLLDECGWGQPRIACASDGRTEFWTYRNGVIVTFAGETLDNVTIEAPGRAEPQPAAVKPAPRRDYRRRQFAFWAIVFAAVSAFALIAGVRKNAHNAQIRTWPRADATVTRVSMESDNDRTGYWVEYAYRDGNEPRTDAQRIGDASAWQPGRVVPIRYAPGRSESYIESEIIDANGTIGFSVFMALVSAALLVRLAFVIKAQRAAR